MSLAQHFSKTRAAASGEQVSSSFRFGFALCQEPAKQQNAAAVKASGGFANPRVSGSAAGKPGAAQAAKPAAAKSKNQKKREKEKQKKKKQASDANEHVVEEEEHGEVDNAGSNEETQPQEQTATTATAQTLETQSTQPEPEPEPVDITEALRRLQKAHISGPAGARSKMKNKAKAKKQQEKRSQVMKKAEEQREAPVAKQQPEFQTWRDPKITDEERKKRRFGQGIRNLRAIGQRKAPIEESQASAGPTTSASSSMTTTGVAPDGVVAHSSPFSFGFSFDA
jgi:hypothetical protein